MVMMRALRYHALWLSLAACGRIGFDGAARDDAAGDVSMVDAAITYPQAVMADHPVAYWRLGETSGTIALDSSGNGLNGTYVGSVSLGAVGAIVGDQDTAIALNGAGFVRIPNAGPLDNISIVTVEAWARGASTNATQLFSAAGGGGYQVVWNAGVAGAYAMNTYVNAKTKITDALWHQIVVAWDGAAATVYLDGVASNTGPNAILPNSLENQIGTQCSGAGSTMCSLYLAGSVDEVSVYDQALPAARVQAHYVAATAM
jgi:hypothetical protein